ncbi:HalOD1 output domain-containing protein [Halobacterium litoreum]|uniref:HalOD1 output domain-containing protein n=1 Tax=Halobacterium litoreum TaxID=2039234 RepID=A0ABD5NFW1_9EURY|nr:HalOD1 output domain-containing protein [Halobacterium litoreum]UHH13343.1 hypothetical protein LT972_14440 [Halobacterium litoreum]
MTEDTSERATERIGPSRASERTQYSWTDAETPSIGVVEAVAAATDSDVTDLPQLADTLDPDALNDVLADAGSDVHISFEYANAHVAVSSAGTVTVGVE